MKKTIICLIMPFLVVFTSFSQTITISPTITSGSIDLRNYQFTPAVQSYSADGTSTAPTATTNGRAMLSLAARGYTGSAYSAVTVAKIDFRAEGNFTPISQGASIRFSTTAMGAIFPSEKMMIAHNGNVGIGTTTPNAPLQFSNTSVNRKIVLAETANNDHQVTGFGVNGGLRYQIASTTDAHVFNAGTSASSSDELMRIQGNGNVGIGTSNPTNAKLEIIGGSSRGFQSYSVSEMGVRGLSDSNFGILGESSSSDGVRGISATSSGVNGVSTSGIGVRGDTGDNQAFYGNNNSISNPTARFDNQTVGGNALHVQGGIKVSGTKPAAFSVSTTNSVSSIVISPTNTLANAATDLLFITRASDSGLGTNASYFAQWNGSGWEIRRENNATIGSGITINVLVIKQ